MILPEITPREAHQRLAVLEARERAGKLDIAALHAAVSDWYECDSSRESTGVTWLLKPGKLQLFLQLVDDVHAFLRAHIDEEGLASDLLWGKKVGRELLNQMTPEERTSLIKDIASKHNQLSTEAVKLMLKDGVPAKELAELVLLMLLAEADQSPYILDELVDDLHFGRLDVWPLFSNEQLEVALGHFATKASAMLFNQHIAGLVEGKISADKLAALRLVASEHLRSIRLVGVKPLLVLPNPALVALLRRIDDVQIGALVEVALALGAANGGRELFAEVLPRVSRELGKVLPAFYALEVHEDRTFAYAILRILSKYCEDRDLFVGKVELEETEAFFDRRNQLHSRGRRRLVVTIGVVVTAFDESDGVGLGHWVLMTPKGGRDILVESYCPPA